MPTRRALLAAGAAAALSPVLRAQAPATGPKPPEGELPLPPDRRVGFAVVGLGDFATKQILPSFAESNRCRLVAAVTGDPAKGRDLLARYGGDPKAVYGYDEIEKLRERDDVRVVYVITPNSLHRRDTEAAARAGKHVLCEKPLATSVGDAEAMIAACRRANVLLMTAYRARYEPFNQEAIRLCRSGELGRIVSVSSDHGRILDPNEKRDRWRMKRSLAGGGSLMDIGIYSLQAARYLTGEEPKEIGATLHSPKNDPRFAEVEDTVHAVLTFPSGALAHLVSSYSWAETKRYTVFGDRTRLTLDPATDYYEHRLTLGDRQGERDVKIAEQNQFARMMDHLARCVEEGRTPDTPGEEGLRDLRLLMRIYEAAAAGRTLRA